LHKRRVISVDPWETVKHLFDCRNIESSLLRLGHLADYLLAAQPHGGYSKVKGDLLTADKVWSCLFAFRLEMPADYLDTYSLLEWAGGDCRAYLEAPADLKESTRERVFEICGEYGRAILDTVDDGRVSPLALGLALRCLLGCALGKKLRREQERALLRLEQYTGNKPLQQPTVREWAEVAERLYRSQRLGDLSVLHEAEKLLCDLQAEALCELSDYLPLGLEQRFEPLCQALAAALESPASLPELQESAQRCLSHRGLKAEQTERLEMIPRLVRWLHSSSPSSKLPLYEQIERYSRSTAYASWARLKVEGTGPPLLAQAVCDLLDKVVSKLEAEAEAFAGSLAAWNRAGEPDHRVLKIENLIAKVLEPLANQKGGRFLMIVLDGCGWPTLHEIMESFPAVAWKHVAPEGGPIYPAALATYPSITECSRASLFSGKLTRGSASTETRDFKEHPTLRAACNQKCPPLVFHKGDLEGAHGNLSTELESKIADPKHKAVAVVLNAVDDHLEKGEQLPLNSISYLTDLCTLAHRAGRVLILTSDHGHVLERGAELRAPASEPFGARWRSGEKVEKGEILLTGPRALAQESGVILPWTEKLRYTKKKNGYHGGCHPAELLAPLMVLAPVSSTPEGWHEIPYSKPVWWLDRAVTIGPSVQAKKTERPAKKKAPESGQMLLIEEPPTLLPEFAERALQHPVIASQWKNHKDEPDTEWASKLLRALDENAGAAGVSQLASALGLPEDRFRYLLGVAANLLSLDGQYLVSLSPDMQKVLLNKSVLADGAASVSTATKGTVIQAVRHGDAVRFEVPVPGLSKSEQSVLELLTQYGQLSESELKKALGTRRVSAVVERLMEKLHKEGFSHLRQVGEGAGGRLYRLELEAVLK